MNECGGRSLGKPLCNAALNKALRMPEGGGMEVPAPEGAWSGCREPEEEEEDRAGERGSLETPPRQPSHRRPLPSLAATPAGARPRGEPQQPRAPAHRLPPSTGGGRAPYPERNYPGGPE